MAQNRYLPFGYKVENGATVIHETEAALIRNVFHRYAQGDSYKTIAAALSLGEVRYMPDKPLWNKNMVARLLQNEKYLGTAKYPAIITEQEWQAAQRAQKPYTHTESAELKSIKPLLVCECCGAPIKRRLKRSGDARWYCETDTQHISLRVTDDVLLENVRDQMNRLIRQPQSVIVKPEKKNNLSSLTLVRLQNEIDSSWEQSEFDEAALKEKIFAQAQERYALCDDTAAKTDWLVGTLERTAPDTWMKTGLLRQITDKIIVAPSGNATLVLKNGQQVGREG